VTVDGDGDGDGDAPEEVVATGPELRWKTGARRSAIPEAATMTRRAITARRRQ
jgi:hypothetical protein